MFRSLYLFLLAYCAVENYVFYLSAESWPPYRLPCPLSALHYSLVYACQESRCKVEGMIIVLPLTEGFLRLAVGNARSNTSLLDLSAVTWRAHPPAMKLITCLYMSSSGWCFLLFFAGRPWIIWKWSS